MSYMKAVVRYGNEPEALEVREMPVPEIGPTEVLIRVAYAGVCGSDVHNYRREAGGIEQPVIQGHEFAGTIEAVGDEVIDYAVGDHVVPTVTPYSCGACLHCRSGHHWLCAKAKTYGYSLPGAFAKYTTAPARSLYRVPDGVSLREACLTEPFGVAYQAALVDSTVRPGDVVVIVGPGPIGALCQVAVREAGAREMIVVGTEGDESRLALVRRLGATLCINGAEEEPLPRVMEATGGVGADLVIDAAGPAGVLELAISAVRPRGQIMKIALGHGPIQVDLDPVIFKSVAIRGHFGIEAQVWEKCLALMASGQVELDPIITHELPLDEWKTAFELAERKEAMKAALTPID